MERYSYVPCGNSGGVAFYDVVKHQEGRTDQIIAYNVRFHWAKLIVHALNELENTSERV